MIKFKLEVFNSHAQRVFSADDCGTNSNCPIKVLPNGMLEVEINPYVGDRKVMYFPPTLTVLWQETK